jgi:transaldolase
VNVTLIFGLDRYDSVMDAYLEGLERAKENGKDLSKIYSVASFFVSRVDTEIDKRLEASGGEDAAKLAGLAGIANARLAYKAFEEKFSGDRFVALKEAGANVQRPLWASTGVKNPDYRDTMYVTDLAVSNTVNTMPEKTLQAFADHGEVQGDQVTGKYDDAQQVMDDLKAAGIDYDDVVQTLEDEGLDKFEKAWESLIESVTDQLEKAGADVDPDGAASPAGDGPAAASRGESA